MTSLRQRAAIAILRWSAHVLPREHAEWADAMYCEIEAIEDDGAALDFAVGCFRASLMARILDKRFAIRAIKVVVPAALLFLALFAAFLAGRHADSHQVTAMVFAGQSAVFAIGTALFLSSGFVALMRLSGALIALYLCIAALIVASGTFVGGTESAHLYRALALEGIAIWVSVLGAALLIIRSSVFAGSHRGGVER